MGLLGAPAILKAAVSRPLPRSHRRAALLLPPPDQKMPAAYLGRSCHAVAGRLCYVYY